MKLKILLLFLLMGTVQPLQDMEVTVTDASGYMVYYGILSCVEVD